VYQGIGYEIEAVMPAAIDSTLMASLCTIFQPDGVLVGAGQPSGNYVAISGATAVPCMDAPRSTGERLSADEMKAIPEIQARVFRHVLLSGFYGDVIPWGDAGARPTLRAVITGPDSVAVTYEVLGVESDSQQQMTRLSLHQVTN
jgi:hypothetical protein